MTDVLRNGIKDDVISKHHERNKHRRTQSNSALDMDALLNRKRIQELQEIPPQPNPTDIVNATQKALEASRNNNAEKEVIIDNIDEIPNNGVIVPKYPSALNNPLNFVKKRNLSSGIGHINPESSIKKITMHTDMAKINDLTGLNTIYERKNSNEDLDADVDNNIDSKPSVLSKHSSRGAAFERISSKHSSPRKSIEDIENRLSHRQKERDSWENSLSLKKSQINCTTDLYFPDLTLDALEKYQSKKTESRSSSKENKNDINSSNAIPKSAKISKHKSNAHSSIDSKYFFSLLEKARQKNKGSNYNTLKSTKYNSSRETVKPITNVSRTLESVYRSKTPQNSKGFHQSSYEVLNSNLMNSKSTKSCKTFAPNSIEQNVINLDEYVKKLNDRTNFLEREVKFLMEVIEGLQIDKSMLKKKIKDQDLQINHLQKTSVLYEQKIKILQSKRKYYTIQREERKDDSNSYNNFLNTTETSTLESPFPSSSNKKNISGQSKKSLTTPFQVPPVDIPTTTQLNNSNKKYFTLKPEPEFKTTLKTKILKNKFIKK